MANTCIVCMLPIQLLLFKDTSFWTTASVVSAGDIGLAAFIVSTGDVGLAAFIVSAYEGSTDWAAPSMSSCC